MLTLSLDLSVYDLHLKALSLFTVSFKQQIKYLIIDYNIKKASIKLTFTDRCPSGEPPNCLLHRLIQLTAPDRIPLQLGAMLARDLTLRAKDVAMVTLWLGHEGRDGHGQASPHCKG